MDDNCFVSVGVVTYNSSKTIVETLNSIKDQTYNAIELIIADDGSIDDTIKICNDWLACNKSRFVNTKLIESHQNRGIPANCNSLLASVNGEWLKMIAGDDILLTDCIQKCVDYANSSSEIKWLVGKSLKYIEVFDEAHLNRDDTVYSNKRMSVLCGTLEVQQSAIVYFNFIEAPNLFFQTKVLREVGGYNEKYKMIEDWPLNLKLIQSGYKCYFLNDFIVGYRQSNSSVYNVKSKPFNIGYKESLFSFEHDELFKHHSKKYRINKTLHYKLCFAYQKLGFNNSNRLCKKVYSFLSDLIDGIIKIK